MIEYIRESIKRFSEQHPHMYGKPVHILKPFTEDINFNSILKSIESMIPESLTGNFEVIYVGDFSKFHKNDRALNAFFKDGAIYITNKQESGADLIDDIVHEIAHSIEKTPEYNDIIYGDNAVESEFLAKRRTLSHIVDKPTYGILKYLNPNYNVSFDDHLYKDLGYDYLRVLTSNLFYSPYAITSLKEYWANGFENYLLGDKQKLKDLSPMLYNVIVEVFEQGENKYEY
jgi:hypothetical protein